MMLMNAAGNVKTPEQVDALLDAPIDAIMVGSITVEPREGNSGDVYYSNGYFSLNALGLPNKGLAWYRDVLPSMVRKAHDSEKDLYVSVAGFSPQETRELVEAAVSCDIDLIEINAGCPNVWDGGKQKRILSFDIDALSHTCDLVKDCRIDLSVKLSPISDPGYLSEVAAVLDAAEGIKVVTACNTFPNSYFPDSKIAIGGGFAGMAGSGFLPIALGQVVQLKAFTNKPIFGVGGIHDAATAKLYLDAGAYGVQVGTAFVDYGSKVLTRIREGLA